MARPASPPPEIPGFTFVRPLGQGGFADVYLYEQHLPRRQVAVKVLLTDGLDSGTRQAFVDEANVMAQLSAHPYIVTIYHADVAAGDRPYFVMEYCSGPSLSARYKSEQFAADDALRIGVRLAGAIATAHSVGILHRDIKPANVLTNDFGWPALTDFGISSAVEDIPTHTMTVSNGVFDTGSSAGTGQSVGMSVPWSPPEMFADDPQPDVRSDVFSLAATIHTLLAGRSPFELPGRGNGTIDLIGRIERGAITPMAREDIPRSLVAVLAKGMAVRPADRYSTAVDFARALQRVELELGYSPTGIEVPNLNIAVGRPEAGGDPADETRLRSVQTVEAQLPVADKDETTVRAVTSVPQAPRTPPAPASAKAKPASVPANDLGATMVRPRRQAAAEAEAAPSPATSPSGGPLPRRPMVVVLGSIGALLVIVIVIASVVFGGALVRTPVATHSPVGIGDGTSAIVDDIVPIPIDGTAEASSDGRSVTFAWSNPEPKDGDSYRYARSEDPDSRMPLQESTVIIDGVDPGSRFCIDAYIVRAGQLSPDPLTICYPE